MSDRASTVTDTPTGSERELRQRAEENIKAIVTTTPDMLSLEVTKELLHELRVHQIELEMQNEELRRTQYELECSRTRYFDLYDLAPVGYLTLSEQGLIQEANLAAATMLGMVRDALVQQPLSLVILDEDQDIYYLNRKKLLKTGEQRDFEIRMMKTDGTAFWVHLTASAEQGPLTRSEQGADDASVYRVVLSDITERKITEEALRNSEKLYRSLFGNMLNGFAYCQMIYQGDKPHDLVYLAVNSAFESLTGLKDVVGRKISEVIPGIRETDPQLLEVYGRVARTGQPERLEIFIEALQMWFWLSVYSTAQEHFVAVFDVITDRKKAEQDILDNQRKLREMTFDLQMAEDRERARIAGELHDRVGQRLLLGKMKIDMLSEAIPDEANEISGLIEESIQDIRFLTFQLRPPLLATAGLVEAVTWLCSELKDDYGLEAEVLDDQKPKPFKYEVLSVLYQAVRELLLNVVKHAGTNQASLTLGCEGDSLFLTVADEGCGFNSTEAGTRKTKTGGYGLFNLQQRIEYLGGRFVCETSPGKGTRSTIIFPLAKN